MGFGPAPWGNKQSFEEYRQQLLGGYKRVSKKQLQKAGIESSLSRGWSKKLESSWDKQPQAYEKRRVRAANGRYYYVPEDAYGDTIAFTSRPSNEQIEQYIDSASWKYDTATKHPNPCGHIARLEYAPYRQLMRVTFSKASSGGDCAVYFRVPNYVYGTLYWLFLGDVYQASPVTGEQRHAVGIQFWDLVRIRKTIHEGHFSFSYTGSATPAEEIDIGGF